MNRYLLDTHILLWWLSEPQRLPAKLRRAISDSDNILLVSAAALWEMSIKCSIGRLQMPDDLIATLADEQMQVLPINARHALAAGTLAYIHRDPFDRMQVAQAQIDSLILVTADKQIHEYDAPMWRVKL